MSAYRDEQPAAVVATASSSAAAELAQMTLAAHGIAAALSARDPAHPSLDFVAGIRVTVRSEDEALARELLDGAGLVDNDAAAQDDPPM